MNFPFSSYSELSPTFISLHDVAPALSDEENGLGHDRVVPPQLMAYPPLRTYTEDLVFPSPCLLPGHSGLADDIGTMSPVVWESQAEEHQSLFNGPLHQIYSPTDLAFSPEAFSPGHHVPDSTNSYTRMFRGRKSKAAYEAMDELRPYACDICHAAFARSHDRDRHKRSHTGETPYRCHGCGTGFKRPDARKRHWERDPACAQEDWLRVRHTPEGAKRRARAKAKPFKKQIEM